MLLSADGADVFKNITTAAQRGLGPVYATGISGQWVWCRNTSLPGPAPDGMLPRTTWWRHGVERCQRSEIHRPIAAEQQVKGARYFAHSRSPLRQPGREWNSKKVQRDHPVQ